MTSPARDRFLALLRGALSDGTLLKLTLGKYRGGDASLRKLLVRPVTLKSGPAFSFVWRHATRDVTKNYDAAEAFAQIEKRIGTEFLDGHLFTARQNAQLECAEDGTSRLRLISSSTDATRPETGEEPPPHDRPKERLIPADAPWLRALGVTNDRGQPREGMADKFRQIQKFAEVLSHLIEDANFPSDRPLTVVDMGAGKGYLTFAIASLLGQRGVVSGVEARAELVELCSRVAGETGFSNLSFRAGQIGSMEIEHGDSGLENSLDVLIALHACDTATDDALAKGIAAGAKLLVVSPCCQKELRAQLTAPPVLAEALRHGIFQERQAEFVTDALRAQLLEWSGYRTKVFEFISTEHTAKNLMIAAIKAHPSGDPGRAERVRAFAEFYGVRSQKLADHLHFALDSRSAKPSSR